MVRPIITIDGPVSAGKSTVAGILAEKLGYIHLNAGAIYRTITLLALRNGAKAEETEKIIEAAKASDVRFGDEKDAIYLNGDNVSREIRSAEVDRFVPDVARISKVRAEVVKKQRAIAADGGVVAEGRDIGSVVFPNADLKFYLDATPKERGRRRYEELKNKGVACSFEQIVNEIKERDEKDKTREHSPLKKAEDAVLVNTNGKTVEEVVNLILEQVNKKIIRPAT